MNLRNLTTGQWIGIVIAVLGVLGASTTQLTDLFGAGVAKTLVTASNLVTSILSSIMVAMTGQSAQVRAVQDMPGVEKIVVNDQANATLATLATDPKQDKIEPTLAAATAVKATARAAQG